MSEPSAATDVYVSVGGADVSTGTLHMRSRRGTETASFVYATAYLARPDAYALDPDLPLTTGSQHTPPGRATFGAFADTAPDRWGRTLVLRAERARARAASSTPRTLREIDYLLGVRDDLRQGAIRFKHAGAQRADPFLATGDTGIPHLAELPELLALAASAEDDAATYDELRRLVRAGSSLGGARPKAHVIDAAGRVAIAKFPSNDRDTWNVVAWEKTAVDLAAAAGIAVPVSSLLDVGGRSVLVLDRFDRAPDSRRIGYASAMTMLRARDGETRSYLELAEVLEESSAAPTRELEQLWRRMAFNVLISNTDDHLRNHGFLHDRDSHWTLAPAFDLNPEPGAGTRYLSTAIDEAETEASVDLLLEVCDFFRLSRPHALAVLAEVGTAVAGWRQRASANGLDARDLAQMSSAFEHAQSARAAHLTAS